MALSVGTHCPQCGTALVAAVEGICSGCLLELGLQESSGPTAPMKPARSAPSGASDGRPRRSLHPLGSGVVAPTWAMPADLLRQAARRLRLTAFGMGLAFAIAIVLNNLLEASGWSAFARPALQNVVQATTVGISALVIWIAHSRRLTPARLLTVSVTYEIIVALTISLADNLEPLSRDLPLWAVSWLCVWIAIFPLIVPASPKWALIASVASASTWPLAYFMGLGLGNPPAPARIAALNFLKNYIAVGAAMVTTAVIRGLQEMGCYQLLERLDRGGMGEIWRAQHHMLARPVAVKLIRPDVLGVRTPVQAAEVISRFQREAEATAALHSPHTVVLHDFGMTPEGVFYYVMELLEGLDLDSLVTRFGPVPPERAIHLLIEACDSLAEAHEVGLIHRDIKPANIVTCHWGVKWDFVKVLDFGLVKSTWKMGDEDRLTSDGMITGTPAFMAPEAALGGQELDARVDLYGLGCVAYWLLTGHRVFTGRTPVEVIFNHVKTPPIPPSERLGRAIPAPLEDLVLSCLAKERDQRPPSAAWLGDHLAEIETEERWTPARARAWWEQNVGGATGARSASDSGQQTPRRG